MPQFEENIGDSVSVKFNNKEFTFKVENDTELQLTFVRTLFRKSSEITDKYTTIEDVPDSVQTCVQENGYTIVSIQ